MDVPIILNMTGNHLYHAMRAVKSNANNKQKRYVVNVIMKYGHLKSHLRITNIKYL